MDLTGRGFFGGAADFLCGGVLFLLKKRSFHFLDEYLPSPQVMNIMRFDFKAKYSLYLPF